MSYPPFSEHRLNPRARSWGLFAFVTSRVHHMLENGALGSRRRSLFLCPRGAQPACQPGQDSLLGSIAPSFWGPCRPLSPLAPTRTPRATRGIPRAAVAGWEPAMPAGQVSGSKAVCAQAQVCSSSFAVRRSRLSNCGWRDGTVTTQGATMTDQPRLNLVVSWHRCHR